MNDRYFKRKYFKYKTKLQSMNMTGGKNAIHENNDVKKIVEIARNINILGMGEATHGQQLINDFRIKVFKNLVKKCGYTTFVLEDQYSCCERINDYLKHGKGNPKKLVLQLMYFWGSMQMLNLVKWMRRYNIKNDNKLEFKGIDIQSVCLDYDGKNDDMTNIVKNIYKKYEKVDQENWIEADGARDKSMYQVFLKIYDPSKKYFMVAHNFHLAKQDIKEGEKNAKWMGYYLSRKFGKKYFAIGNIFRSGSYLETPDLIETGIEYKWLKDSNNFIIIRDIPKFVDIDVSKLHIGLNVMNRYEPFDAIMVIDNEQPLKLAELY